MDEWIKKTRTSYTPPKRDSYSALRTHTDWKLRDEERYSTQMESKRKHRELYLDKMNFKPNSVIRNKECHYIIIKNKIQQEDKTTINIYLCTEHRNTYIYKVDTNRVEERNRQQ